MLGCKWLDSCENNAFIEFIYLLSRFAGEIVCHARGTLTAVASFCSFVPKINSEFVRGTFRSID